jgi:hypothetical protein
VLKCLLSSIFHLQNERYKIEEFKLKGVKTKNALRSLFLFFIFKRFIVLSSMHIQHPISTYFALTPKRLPPRSISVVFKQGVADILQCVAKKS